MTCKDCTERKTGCHSSCKSYKQYREKIEQGKQNRRDYYLTSRAGFEITLKHKVRTNKPLGNMRIL